MKSELNAPSPSNIDYFFHPQSIAIIGASANLTKLSGRPIAALLQKKFAQIKSCEELKTEIEAKLTAKGVKEYTLEIIPADQVKDQKIVGSCEGGTKKISYSRDASK